MHVRAFDPVEAETIPPVSAAVPSSFLKLSGGRQCQCCDRELGYFGDDRFVMFYYEPRGQDVIWVDGRSSGFGTGGWRCFFDQIEPLARRHGVDVGDVNRRGRHALVVDRQSQRAYFADQDEAHDFVTRHRRAMSA